MSTTQLNFGIPDIDLPWTGEGTVNPSSFAGHQLLVLFLGDDAHECTATLQRYARVADELSRTGAWLLVIANRSVPSDAPMPIASDPDGKAWSAFRKLSPEADIDQSLGATFAFTRGGAFHRVWPGCGHIEEVIEELISRS